MPDSRAQRPGLLAKLDRWTRHPVVSNVAAGLLVVGIVALISWGASQIFGNGTAASRSSGSSSAGSGSTAVIQSNGSDGTAAPARSLGPQLTASQLAAVLIPGSKYEAIAGTSLGTDTVNYSLRGGIAALKLCSSTIPAVGLGADSSSAFAAPSAYFGSDAATFAGDGAEQFLATAAAQAATCGWRALPGQKLDDQVVRLTTDMPFNTEPLHYDVILIRSGAAVLEIGTATISGSHSSDAEKLADDAAVALAQATHHA